MKILLKDHCIIIVGNYNAIRKIQYKNIFNRMVPNDTHQSCISYKCDVINTKDFTNLKQWIIKSAQQIEQWYKVKRPTVYSCISKKWLKLFYFSIEVLYCGIAKYIECQRAQSYGQWRCKVLVGGGSGGMPLSPWKMWVKWCILVHFKLMFHCCDLKLYSASLTQVSWNEIVIKAM